MVWNLELIYVSPYFFKRFTRKIKESRKYGYITKFMGGDIDGESVSIYFLYAEDEKEYHLILSKDIFDFIISEWINFIETVNYQEKKEITI